MYTKLKEKTMLIALKIKKINEFNEYILQDNKTKKEHRLILEFFEIKPKVGDIILLDEKLLDPKSDLYIQSYAFTKLDENDDKTDEIDIAGLVCGDKNYFLKRMYG